MRWKPLLWWSGPQKTIALTKKHLADKANNPGIFMAIILLVACVFLSVIIPPMKSPDEPDHMERAYLLTKGVWVLDRPQGKSSGGNIDTGLLDYIAIYPPPQDKITTDVTEAAGEIRWSKQRVFDPSPGTGYYFPAIYAPQAAGLYLGERLGLTVDHSYRLARALTLMVSVLFIGAAFTLYAPNAMTLALLVMPMSLFQFASASLDGITTALAVLSIALFQRLAADKKHASGWMQTALAMAVVLLVTSRIHALPFVLLLVAAWRYAPSKRTLSLMLISGLWVAVWTGLAIKTTVDLRVVNSAPTSQVLLYYLRQPLHFIDVLWATLSDTDVLQMYGRTFIGVLGWLDTPFSHPVYRWLGGGLLLTAILTCSYQGIQQEWPHRLLLAGIAIASVGLIFLALLVTWTPHPADKIIGIQGRYFLIPAIVLAYSMAGTQGMGRGWRKALSVGLCFGVFVYAMTATTKVLLNRYYLSPQQPPTEQITYDPAPQSQQPQKMLATAPLENGHPIRLHLPALGGQELGQIRKIAIRLGTHGRENPGKAELWLRADDGTTFRKEWSLPELVDNSDHAFTVPAHHYTEGEIRFVTGGGISVWESHGPAGQVVTCMKLFYTFNKTVVVAGCP